MKNLLRKSEINLKVVVIQLWLTNCLFFFLSWEGHCFGYPNTKLSINLVCWCDFLTGEVKNVMSLVNRLKLRINELGEAFIVLCVIIIPILIRTKRLSSLIVCYACIEYFTCFFLLSVWLSNWRENADCWFVSHSSFFTFNNFLVELDFPVLQVVQRLFVKLDYAIIYVICRI